MTRVREKELAALLSDLVDLRADLDDRIKEEAECPGESGLYGRDGIAYSDRMIVASEFLRIAQACLSDLVKSFGSGDTNDGD
jgi:hypothetical protein